MDTTTSSLDLAFGFHIDDLVALSDKDFDKVAHRLKVLQGVAIGGDPAQITELPNRGKKAKETEEPLPDADQDEGSKNEFKQFVEAVHAVVNEHSEEAVSAVLDEHKVPKRTNFARRLSAVKPEKFEDVLKALGNLEAEPKDNEEGAEESQEEGTSNVTFDMIKDALAAYQAEHGKEAGSDILKNAGITTKSKFNEANPEDQQALLDALI